MCSSRGSEGLSRTQACGRNYKSSAILEGDADIDSLVTVSYYDQNLVHFLSTICEMIKWVQCTKHVYCVETEQVEVVRFLCLNINDDYNYDMGNVDIADQLRNYYRFDHWMRKRKWWWSLFFWAFGVLLVNAYVSFSITLFPLAGTQCRTMTFANQLLLHGLIQKFIGQIEW